MANQKQPTPEQMEQAQVAQRSINLSKNINPKYPSRNIIPSQAIEQHIQNLWRHSVRCLWEVSMRCPCVSIDTNSPRPNCPICHGEGYFYPESYELDMGMQSDENKYNIGGHGKQYLPGTIATPQFGTVSGVPSQNIKPGDRITVLNWTTPQEYIFNVTNNRLNDGVFLPYKTKKVIKAFTTTEEGDLSEVSLDKLNLREDNFLEVKDKSLLSNTISVLLNIEKRFYVESLLKELRYENFDRSNEKGWATGNGNKFLSFDQLKNGIPQYNGTQTFQMPNELMLRRETFFNSPIGLIENETDNPAVIKNHATGDLMDWMNGD